MDKDSPKEISTFDISLFIKFLADHNVLSIAIATVLSRKVNDVMDSVIDNIIMPVINRDSDNDGVRDVKKLEDQSIKLYGMNFGVGKVLISIIKFIVVTYFLFLVTKSIKDFFSN